MVDPKWPQQTQEPQSVVTGSHPPHFQALPPAGGSWQPLQRHGTNLHHEQQLRVFVLQPGCRTSAAFVVQAVIVCARWSAKNRTWADTVTWTQDVYVAWQWICGNCGLQFLVDDCLGRGPGGKGIKGDKGEKGKKGAGQLLHSDAGTKGATPPKGKGTTGTNQN